MYRNIFCFNKFDSVCRFIASLTLRTSEDSIPALHKLPCGVARRYTGFAQTSLWRRTPVYRPCANFPVASHAGIPALFSKAYWHQNAQVIEIQTRQQLKNIFFPWNSEFLWTSFAFGHLAAIVRVRCSEFLKLRVYAIYSNRRPPSFVWRALRNFAMAAFEENVEEMVGTTREAVAVATESGGPGTRQAVPGTRPVMRRRRRLVTRRWRSAG